jgi:protein-export membrane protein SecD
MGQSLKQPASSAKKYQTYLAIWVVLLGVLGAFIYETEVYPSNYKIKYGLDLSGGTHLVFDADTSDLAPTEVSDSMQSLRQVIEQRVNALGTSEAVVQVESAGLGSGDAVDQRLIVELPGVTDVAEAVETIGRTPVLEFKLLNPDFESPADTIIEIDPDTGEPVADIEAALDEQFISTGLNGSLLERSILQFGNGQQYAVNEPVVLANFNDEGEELFEQITRDNVGGTLAIFLDGAPISLPRINEPITGGTAVISGGFTAEEAKQLVDDLNLGALPVPIELSSVQKIGATLGAEAREGGILAGIIGLAAVALFLIIRYRLAGVVAVVALALYIALILSAFKVFGVVLTAAGIAGFILSIGMAVDANVLIFERLNEELQDKSKTLRQAVIDGFARAWPSIRDGNLSSLITGVILYWIGTSLLRGFAVTFVIGIIVSVITAVFVTRTALLAISTDRIKRSWLATNSIINPGSRSNNN